MKVFGLPSELQATLPQVDYTNFSYDKMIADEDKHRASIRAWLVEQGYTGKHTGGILQMPIADGHAEYMLADGSGSFLLHLPYGDAWDSPDVEFLPKKEVVKRINARVNLNKLFGGKL